MLGFRQFCASIFGDKCGFVAGKIPIFRIQPREVDLIAGGAECVFVRTQRGIIPTVCPVVIAADGIDVGSRFIRSGESADRIAGVAQSCRRIGDEVDERAVHKLEYRAVTAVGSYVDQNIFRTAVKIVADDGSERCVVRAVQRNIGECHIFDDGIRRDAVPEDTVFIVRAPVYRIAAAVERAAKPISAPVYPVPVGSLSCAFTLSSVRSMLPPNTK